MPTEQPSISVGSICLTLASPSAPTTSARPCAAPARSTVEPPLESESRSHGSRSGNCSSPSPAHSRPRALAPVERTSGIGSSSTARSSGSSCPRYGTMSRRSESSEHMLPVMCDALRFPCAERSRNPRCSTGTMSASEGGSTQCSNWQWASASMAAPVLVLGSLSAASSVGTSCAISGFLMTAPTEPSAALAPSLTFGCEWVSASVSRGTTCGSVAESCLGAQYAIEPSSSTAACFVRHFSSSRALRSEGSTILTPCADSWDMMRCEALTAACRTGPLPSETHVSSIGRMVMMYGSKRRPSVSHRHSNACRAPSRASAACSPLALLSTAACSAVITPCCLSEGMPSPLTTPARPNAAPRRSAYEGVVVSVFCSVARYSGALALTAGLLTSDASDCEMVRCTTSDGVPSAAIRRVTTWATFGSSGGMCVASEPMYSTTPCRMRSCTSVVAGSARKDSSSGTSIVTIASASG